MNQFSKLQDTKSTYKICILCDMCVCVYIYIYITIFQPLKKKEILPFFTAWMKLEGIKLSEISQTERQISLTSLICGIYKRSNTAEATTKLTNTENRLVAGGGGSEK